MSRATFQGTIFKKVKVSGFRNRMASKTKKKIINLRRKKKRSKLTM